MSAEPRTAGLQTTVPSQALPRDDAALVADCRAGDGAAFALLATRHAPHMLRLAERLLAGDHHAAQDVVQECLVKLHATLNRDERPLKVRAWLSVVVRNACMDEHRRRLPQPVAEVPDTAVLDEDPFGADPHLDQAWAALTPRFRTALHHRELLGLTYDEIAEAMQTSRSAVQTLLFRARAALRREYQRAGGELLGCGAFGLAMLSLADGESVGHPPRLAAHVGRCAPCQAALGRVHQIGELLRTGAAAAPEVPRVAPGPVQTLWTALSHVWAGNAPNIQGLVHAGAAVGSVPLAMAAVLGVGALAPGTGASTVRPAAAGSLATARPDGVGATMTHLWRAPVGVAPAAVIRTATAAGIGPARNGPSQGRAVQTPPTGWSWFWGGQQQDGQRSDQQGDGNEQRSAGPVRDLATEPALVGHAVLGQTAQSAAAIAASALAVP